MPITQTSCLIVQCECGLDFEHSDHVPHYRSEGEAREDVECYGWEVWQGHWWEEDCAPLCACGHPIASAHDHGDGPCEEDDCDCQGFQLAEGYADAHTPTG
jgi:hypothetical protein